MLTWWPLGRMSCFMAVLLWLGTGGNNLGVSHKAAWRETILLKSSVLNTRDGLASLTDKTFLNFSLILVSTCECFKRSRKNQVRAEHVVSPMAKARLTILSLITLWLIGLFPMSSCPIKVQFQCTEILIIFVCVCFFI